MSSATFPTSPAFNEQFIPPPPTWLPEEQTPEEYMEKLSNFLGGQYVGLTSLQNSIASGWLISTLRVLDLDADTITSGTIFTQDLYIGSDGNGSIGLLGTSTLIEVVDEAGTTRVQIGDFGASNADWGIKVNNDSGTTVFQATSTTFINGAIINDATLTNAKFPNDEITGAKMAHDTLTDTHIASLSASTINAGTLNVDGAPSAINVTSTGEITFSGGGDITFQPGASSNTNVITWEDFGGTPSGYLQIDSGNSNMELEAANGFELILRGNSTGHISLDPQGGIVFLGGDSADEVRFSGELDSSIAIDNHDTFEIGTTSFRLADAWFVDTHTSGTAHASDIRFDNDWVLTEPDKVWLDADRHDGMVWMNEKWEPVKWMHRTGKDQITNLPAPTVFPKSREERVAEVKKNMEEHRARQAVRQAERIVATELKRIDNEPARLARLAKREKSINDGKEHQRRKTNNTTTKTG